MSLLCGPLSAFHTNITGHKRLFTLGIYHCDISDNNLMFVRKNSHTFGTLIDVDLAVIVDMPSENQRHTDTRTSMAIQLLLTEESFKRHYRHDAESFFSVVVYNSTFNHLVNGWGFLTNRELGAQKVFYLGMGTGPFTCPSIVSWVDGFREFFLPSAARGKDWDIDELYNTLRRFRHDQGMALSAHILSTAFVAWWLLANGTRSTVGSSPPRRV